ncbi:Uncharacterized conserved protein, DUF1330 family [Albimonas donghaensis]|uniref:Uncharacterized conserved protein, DUF1330 family n=1 Tax=Albimonas donghaensis TaxID=356660 RepID=A0A1H3EKU8_9RHOB|nr:DUF1330 domain-containing protein [Albimonas donghaensis]SDX78574.1 Uncharacterized conserved protein, DUF1330 family [Albimonas donghaensis]
MTEACIDPTRSAFEAFKALPRDEPLAMLNLVRFRDRAEYEAGHALAGAGLTGAEAYANYGRDSAPVFSKVGGAIAWRGDFRCVLIGPEDEAWDEVFVASYPTASSFLAMVTDPVYQQAVKHRQAAVATSRLIRCAPAEAGAVFG